VLDVTFAEDASRIRKDNARSFPFAAFGRESASAREDGEGKLSDEKGTRQV